MIQNLQRKDSQWTPFILPDLISIQRDSFLLFLERGLATELSHVTPLTGSHFRITLCSHGYRLKRPKVSIQEAVYQATSYSAALYVNVETNQSNLGTQETQIQSVWMGDIPLMTSRGHFIINGSSRVVVNQIVRSPGIYFKEMIDQKHRRMFQASIISNRGSWVRLETDVDGMIWVRMDKAKKISILIVLEAMGLSKKTIFRSLKSPEFLFKALQQLLAKKRWQDKVYELIPQSTTDALFHLYTKLSPDKPGNTLTARRVLYEKLMDAKRYDVGLVGRVKLNKKLKLPVPEHVHTLRPVDFLAATDYLIGLEYGRGQVDDIDHLKNRRVRCAGELIQSQLRIGLNRLERTMQGRISRPGELPGMSSLMNPKPVMAALREFFGSNPLSQFMDQTNPLAELTHKRRLSSLGPGGLSQDRAGMAVREIHPSQYGRICPIETPEGPNAGLIGSMATYARLNQYGGLECPFYQVVEGKVLYEFGPIFLTAEQEDQVTVVAGDILDQRKLMVAVAEGRDPLDPAVRPTLPDRPLILRSRQEFHTGSFRDVNYVGIAPTQMISVATSLIPFLEHDDANRALMGSNMQRQAVPLLKTEAPIIGTGLEAQVAADAGGVVQSPFEGIVVYVDATRIVVSTSKSKLALSKKRKIHESNVFLQVYQRSNQGTCIHQRPIIPLHTPVIRGDLLADGSSTSGGQIALGKNLLVAYMPWEGYNFEDAILISERLIYDDLYTSLHIERYEVETQHTKLGPEEITKSIVHETDDKLPYRWLDERGIVMRGAWVEPGDVLIGKITPKEEKELTPELRLVYAIFGKRPKGFRDTSLRVPQGVRGRVVDVRMIRDEDTKVVHVYVCQQRQIQVGDKMAGRHGNKGIVSRIVPRQDMPYLQDGTPVDMVLNPLGVPSRMNVGQVFECLLGLAGQRLGQQLKVRAFDEMYGAEASRHLVYNKLHEASEVTGHHWLFDPNHPGKSRLIDGRTGDMFDQAVTIGQAYMLKLIHQVDDKIHARATGPYSLITQQPLGGRSKRGGQRLGEMEVWAFEGFGAAYTLQELLTVKSDDMQGRNEIMSAMVQGRQLPEMGTPESFKVMIRELQALCLDIGIYHRSKMTFKTEEIDLMQMR
uniref:DNA-directed RNA polymerase subunit beta n=1 Tax=Nephroselmis olivacea TaxID=31312 RepID=RPOB_NEPOL|nr:RNA polymerase beta subunit [Nephroselmis olivacea]Q9TL06.1 RecName: Full=DNA-directed RNA polymerase subunit beta; AltName: Full=PEP; AltName: Full=Plastid-encoded RNA polymerase subunit beta; Short=RNA polymerase subunit beta [Nephroselmis olivacea]AAD54810.1 beta subunit of RNA polymerase [Nephroselmis olivacea]